MSEQTKQLDQLFKDIKDLLHANHAFIEQHDYSCIHEVFTKFMDLLAVWQELDAQYVQKYNGPFLELQKEIQNLQNMVHDRQVILQQRQHNTSIKQAINSYSDTNNMTN